MSVLGSWPSIALTSRCGCVQGKVVFVAPTRPLVNQQIDAVSGGLLYMAVPVSHVCTRCSGEWSRHMTSGHTRCLPAVLQLHGRFQVCHGGAHRCAGWLLSIVLPWDVGPP